MSLEENIFMARVAEQAERFDDMVSYLQEVVKSKAEDFTTEERNLLSVGFKNQIGSKRTALRTIGAIEQNPKYSKFNDSLAQYKKKIEKLSTKAKALEEENNAYKLKQLEKQGQR